MCGIAGILHRSSLAPILDQRLTEVASRLSHRGPDGSGRYSRPGVALVHTRLSLVDPNPRSDQPFFDRSGRYALIYNGEVYGFQALRAELERNGIEFRTTSDTEVVLESLLADLRDGIQDMRRALRSLDGMFAFALFDTETETLTIGRDLLGIKPLFFKDDGDVFAFASEFHALGALVPLAPDPISCVAYLDGRGVPTRGSTLFAGVRIVEPGSTLTVSRKSGNRVTRFRTLPELFDADRSKDLAARSTNEWVDELDRRLNRAVEGQLFADAPIGAYCSGGLDSSVIVAIAARSRKDLAIFHADVVGPTSERAAAEQLAKHLGLDLAAVPVQDSDFVSLLPEVMLHYGYPFSGHPNSIPFLRVSQLVRERAVKGVLSGEGSDECFLGYTKYFPTLGRALSQWPRRIAERLRIRFGRAQKLRLRRLERSEVIPGLLHRFGNELEIDAIEHLLEGKREGEIDLGSITSLKALSHHLRTLLHRNDCLGMAASVEARFPYLDLELLRFIVHLPRRAKMRFSLAVHDERHPFVTDKWLLRKLAERYLPKALSARPKRGFTVRAQKSMAVDHEFFKDGFVAALFTLGRREARFLHERADQELRVRLLQLEAWGSIFFQGATPDHLRDRLLRHVKVGNQRASDRNRRSN